MPSKLGGYVELVVTVDSVVHELRLIARHADMFIERLSAVAAGEQLSGLQPAADQHQAPPAPAVVEQFILQGLRVIGLWRWWPCVDCGL